MPAKPKRERREGGWFRRIGIVGLLGTLLLNAVMWIAMDQQGSEPFSNDWWSGWFPAYPFWGVFLLVGFAGRRRVAPRYVLPVEEIEGAKPSKFDAATNQIIFDRVFKIYIEKRGKELNPQIIRAIGAVVRSDDEALALFERCKALENDARHFMRMKVFGQIDLSTVRRELMDEHPYLSDESLQRAIEFGEGLVPKE